MLSSLILASFVAAAAPEPSLLEEGSHCVAYRVQKTMFLFKKDMVVGKNCDISAQVLPEVGGLYHIEVNVPVRSFASGDSDRDKDVAEILKGAERPELTYRTKAMTSDQWYELFQKKSFTIDGEMLIGLKSYPLTLHATYVEKPDAAEVDGVIKVKFEQLGMSPPSVGAGVVAKAKSDVELHFHLLSSRILGADSLRLGKAKQ